MRDYTPENESFRDDAIALTNGVAITIAVMGTWTRPVYMGLIALIVAAIGYFLSPRSRGGTVLAVGIIWVLSLLVTAFLGHSLV